MYVALVTVGLVARLLVIVFGFGLMSKYRETNPTAYRAYQGQVVLGFAFVILLIGYFRWARR